MLQFLTQSTWADRTGWVLVHSLWQFALVALLALVLQRALQRCSAASRYRALLAAMAIMVAMPVATWLSPWAVDAPAIAARGPVENPEKASPSSHADDAMAALPAASPVELRAKPQAASLRLEHTPIGSVSSWSMVKRRVQPWLAEIVLVWLAGVWVAAFRPLLSWYTVHRLTTVGVSPVGGPVPGVLERTAKMLKLAQAAEVLQSTLVQTPTVLGCFRPVVLLPLRVVTGLPAVQLELILAHELAHIRRHDYLVNLLQTLVETLFFYHPVIWWLSRQIRNERENCCDDVAMATVGSRADYGRALLAIEELRATSTALTLAAHGGSLVDRIRRIAGCEPAPRIGGGGILGGVLLSIALFAAMAWAAVPAAEKPAPAAVAGKTQEPAANSRLGDPMKPHGLAGGKSSAEIHPPKEGTYTITSVIQVLKPANPANMNDDFQDARVLAQDKDSATVEVTYYPLHRPAVGENPNWHKDYASMTEYLIPMPTENWDEAMRRDLLAELRQAGIAPDRLTDKQLVEQVSQWAIRRAHSTNAFSIWAVHYPDGKPAVYPPLREAFDQQKPDQTWTDQRMFEQELLGRSMFYNKVHGSCTSSSVYLATIFRALGIPARIVFCIPPFDPNDNAQARMFYDSVHHNQVRETVRSALDGMSGFDNHLFNEVYVGHHWVRLNYKTLGQPILDAHSFGLLTHIYTCSDLSQIPLAQTWGMRYFKYPAGQPKFSSVNPYRLISVHDHFGSNAHVDNPPVPPAELRTVTIIGLYPKGSPAVPKWVTEETWQKTRTDFVIAGQEWISSGYSQMRAFEKRAGHQFLLAAPGHPTVRAQLNRLTLSQGDGKFQAYGAQVLPEDRDKLVPGAVYSIQPINTSDTYRWVAAPNMAPLTLGKDQLASTAPVKAPQPTWSGGDYAGPNGYRLEPPDVIHVEITRWPGGKTVTTGDYLIGPDGSIVCPKVSQKGPRSQSDAAGAAETSGTVHVAGLTPREAEQQIVKTASRQEPGSEFSARVEVSAFNSHVVYVISSKKQGDGVLCLPVTNSSTVASAILQVDGLAAQAAKEPVWLVRPNEPDVKIDWQAITERGSLEANRPLHPGDRIFIGQRPNHAPSGKTSAKIRAPAKTLP
jgi:beta-lactamase regulating signal transducer with metallopeptidase domain/protein involved in polysaccharide export with SLBB domain